MPAITAYRRPYGLRSSSVRGGVLCLPVTYPPMAGDLAASPLDFEVNQDPSLSKSKDLMCRDQHVRTGPEVPFFRTHDPAAPITSDSDEIATCVTCPKGRQSIGKVAFTGRGV